MLTFHKSLTVVRVFVTGNEQTEGSIQQRCDLTSGNPNGFECPSLVIYSNHIFLLVPLPSAHGSSQALKQTHLKMIAFRFEFADRGLEGGRGVGVWRFPVAGEEPASAAVMKFDISFAESSRLHLD